MESQQLGVMESQQLEQQGVSLNAYMPPRVVLNINGVEVTMPPTARMAMTQDHYDPSWDRFGYSLEIDARVPEIDPAEMDRFYDRYLTPLRITADEALGWPETQCEVES